MAKKSGDQRSNPDRRRTPRPEVSRRTIKRDEDSTQLLERGEGPSETTTEGGLGTDVSDRSGGRLSDTREYDTRGLRGTDAEGGYSTFGGGVFPDEGAPEDAPGYGDWTRHSSATEEQGRRRADKGTRQRKSDESLAGEIRDILTNDPELDATEVDVEVEGGAVTISGVVDGTDARLLAEELVESVTGVREVHNRLRVER